MSVATSDPILDPSKLDDASAEKQKSRILKAVGKRLSDFETTQSEMLETIKSLQAENQALKIAMKNISSRDITGAVEADKAGSLAAIRSIQRNSPLRVDGADDLFKSFSVLRAVVAIKTGGKVFGDTAEWDYLKQVNEQRKAAGVVGVESDGGWFIPDQVIPNVINAIYRRSVVVDLAGDGQTRVSVLNGLVGGSVRIPKFKKGVIAYWLGEIDESEITKAGTGTIEMKPRKLNALTKLTEEMIRMGGFGFESLLRNDMIRAMSEKIDTTALYGSGLNDSPEGLTQLGVQQYAVGGNAAVQGELDWTGLSQMDLLIEEADLMKDDTFATISSPAYFNRLANIRVLNYSGQSAAEADYLAGLPPLTEDRLGSLIGDMGKTTGISSTKDVGDGEASSTDVFRGNWGELLLGRWGGLEVVTEDGYDIIHDTRIVKVRSYFDFNRRYEKGLVHCPNAKARD